MTEIITQQIQNVALNVTAFTNPDAPEKARRCTLILPLDVLPHDALTTQSAYHLLIESLIRVGGYGSVYGCTLHSGKSAHQYVNNGTTVGNLSQSYGTLISELKLTGYDTLTIGTGSMIGFGQAGITTSALPQHLYLINPYHPTDGAIANTKAAGDLLRERFLNRATKEDIAAVNLILGVAWTSWMGYGDSVSFIGEDIVDKVGAFIPHIEAILYGQNGGNLSLRQVLKEGSLTNYIATGLFTAHLQNHLDSKSYADQLRKRLADSKTKIHVLHGQQNLLVSSSMAEAIRNTLAPHQQNRGEIVTIPNLVHLPRPEVKYGEDMMSLVESVLSLINRTR